MVEEVVGDLLDPLLRMFRVVARSRCREPSGTGGWSGSARRTYLLAQTLGELVGGVVRLRLGEPGVAHNNPSRSFSSRFILWSQRYRTWS